MMNPFIDGERFSQMRSGSIESGLAMAKQIAESYVGSPVEVLATHGDHMYVLAEGESSIRRLGLRVEDGEVKVISNRYRDGYVDESSVDAYAASLLGDCVDDLIEGKGCNRLRALAAAVGPESRILFHEEYRGAMEAVSVSSYWSSVYESNSALIRSFASEANGGNAEIGTEVTKDRYSSMSTSDLPNFKSELRESLDILLEMVQSSLVSLNSVDEETFSVDGCDPGKLLESLKNDCSTLLSKGRKALQISRENHLPELAELHDAVANSVESMVIMGQFVQSRTEEV
jgi:hypothetical protein